MNKAVKVLMVFALPTVALGAWYDTPTVKAKIDTGYEKSYTYGINLSEDGQFLMVNLGAADDTKPVQLYRTADLIAQWGETKGIKYGEVLGTSLFGTGDNGWKGGAISSTLGLMIPGNGRVNYAIYTSLAIPNYAWTKNENAFLLSGLTDRGIDAMDFNAAGTRLYANQYKVAELKVYDASALKTDHSLSCLKTITNIGVGRIRNLACYTIGGKDLVYFGEGTGGGKVCVYDASDDSVTTISVPTANGDISVVRLSGVASGSLKMYVLVDSGKLLVYALDATGKALAGADPVKAFDASSSPTLAALAGVDAWTSGVTPAYSSFEVTDDGAVAFLIAHDEAKKDGVSPMLCVISTMQGGSFSTDGNNNAYIYGTPQDPYVVSANTTVGGTYAYNGYTGQEGALVVAGATLTANDEMRFGSSDASRTPTKSTTVIRDGTISAKYLVFSGNGTNDKSTQNELLNTIYLNANGSMEGQLMIYDDPASRIVFNGGWFWAKATSPNNNATNPFDGTKFSVFGCGWNSSVHEIFATEENKIDIVNNDEMALANTKEGVGGVQFRFTGPGGFCKNGVGLLKVGNPAAFVMDYAGDTTFKQGTVKLYGDEMFPFGAGKGRMTVDNATLDLNGHVLSVNALECRFGTIANTSSTTATLRIGADGRDSSLDSAMPTNAKLVKKGTGNLTLRAKAGNSVVVGEGVLTVGPVAYRHYRFKPTWVCGGGALCVQFSEFKLVCDGADVTQGFVGVSNSPQSSVNPGEEPDKAVDGLLTTKFTDPKGKAGSGALTQCWLQLDYASPRSIDGYAWATGDDFYNPKTDAHLCRNPINWEFQGSDDGETWITLDSHEGYKQYAEVGKQEWMDAFDIAGNEDALADSSVTVLAGATLRLTGATATLGSLVNKGTVEATDGCKIKVSDGYWKGATSACGGTLMKEGGGTLFVSGRTPTNVEVAGGTLVLTGAVAYTHYRFKPTWVTGGGAACVQFSEFKLICNGEDVTQGFVGVSNSPESSINPGEGPEKAVDGLLTTKFTDPKGKAGSGTLTQCWLQLDYEDARMVTGYTWATANDCYNPSFNDCRNPIDWEFQGSDDGVNWVVLDTQKGHRTSVGANAWINETFSVPYEIGSIEGSCVSVAQGAMLVIPEAATSPNAIVLDLMAGAGTISGFSASNEGSLYLVRKQGISFGDEYELPLTFTNSADLSGLANWDVFVDGKKTQRRLVVRDGKVYLGGVGMLLIVR